MMWDSPMVTWEQVPCIVGITYTPLVCIVEFTNTPIVTWEIVPSKVGITYTPLVTWDSLYSGDYIYTPDYLGSSPLQWKGD